MTTTAVAKGATGPVQHESLKNKTLSDKPLMSCQEARDEAVAGMLVKWPWYGHFTMAMSVQETNQVPIAACGWNPKTGQGTLYFHPENFPRFDLRTRIFAMAHEITHWTHLHVHSHYHGPLVNIAMDMSVNSTLAEMNLKPTHPEEFITVDGVWHKYAALEPGLKQPPDKQSWEWYFNWLLDRQKFIESKLDQLLAKLGLEKGDGGDGDLLSEGVAPGLADKLTDHSGWEDLSEVEKDLVKQYIGNQIERTSASARPPGTIAGALEEFLKALKPKIDWRRYIKNWAGTCGSIDIATTRSRLNKYGGTPRVTLMPRARLLVAQDTSGSVPEQELAQFWGEIEGMVKTLGIDLLVMQVDAQVHSCEKFKKRPSYKVKGRGGTDMTKIFDYINENNLLVDGILVFTDGYTPYPDPRDVRGRKTLWVVTQENMVAQVPKGIGGAIWLDVDQKK